MSLKPPSFVGRTFYNILDEVTFVRARDEMLGQVRAKGGVFAADNLITWNKTLGFMRDDDFASAMNRNTRSGPERGAAWRMHTLLWAARQVAHLDGDFVECACYRGNSARTIADLVDISARRYFLYDLFDHDASMPHHAMEAHSSTLFDEVRARFPEQNVIITQGRVPDSLAQAAPDKIAFMHLDLNNAEAEIGVLEVLWERITPGGILILDDFGWLPYWQQYVAETDWFAARGHVVLEMPTGQGMVVRHA